jgi:hypothetical protein
MKKFVDFLALDFAISVNSGDGFAAGWDMTSW